MSEDPKKPEAKKPEPTVADAEALYDAARDALQEEIDSASDDD